tara:strand:- start:4181 stop:4360 length:180 start_codon:yes stop_codon:yes gene_type:complete
MAKEMVTTVVELQITCSGHPAKYAVAAEVIPTSKASEKTCLVRLRRSARLNTGLERTLS